MQNREDPFAATTATPFAEIFAKMPNVVEEEADDGLRLITAFLRIRDPALRAAAVNFVSELAERSE
jgi:hypothetical protein